MDTETSHRNLQIVLPQGMEESEGHRKGTISDAANGPKILHIGEYIIRITHARKPCAPLCSNIVKKGNSMTVFARRSFDVEKANGRCGCRCSRELSPRDRCP